MRKSVKIAIAVVMGCMVINGCMSNNTPKETKQTTQQEQQVKTNEVPLTEDTYKYDNGFTGKLYHEPNDLVIEDNKTYNVKGIGEVSGKALRVMCRTERFTDASGQPVVVNKLENLPNIESGKDYYIIVPPYIDGKLGDDPAVKYGNNVVTFDCDEDTLINSEFIKVHCDYIVKNIAMNNLVCHMTVLEVINEVE